MRTVFFEKEIKEKTHGKIIESRINGHNRSNDIEVKMLDIYRNAVQESGA